MAARLAGATDGCLEVARAINWLLLGQDGIPLSLLFERWRTWQNREERWCEPSFFLADERHPSMRAVLGAVEAELDYIVRVSDVVRTGERSAEGSSSSVPCAAVRMRMSEQLHASTCMRAEVPPRPLETSWMAEGRPGVVQLSCQVGPSSCLERAGCLGRMAL